MKDHVRLRALSLLVGLAFVEASARAQEAAPPPTTTPPPAATTPAPAAPARPRTNEETLAEKLFVEGRVLVERGDHAGACARFEASYQLVPEAVGTLLNLGLCNEALGKYASAAPFFRAVIERNGGGKADRLELAQSHLKNVEAKMAFLRIEVPESSREPGLVVRIDGNELPPEKWGAEFPADLGEHTIEATAPQKKDLRVKFTLQGDAGHGLVTITRLENLPDTRTLGYIVGGAGIVFLGVGAAFGISVASQCGGFGNDTCKAADNLPDPQRKDKESSLDTQAWISNIGIGLGIVGLGLGTYFVLAAPTKKGPVTVGFAPYAQPGGGGGSLRATF